MKSHVGSTRVPDFLVIGAMKCATTTLHDDLCRHPDIFCGVKELNALTRPIVFQGSAQQVYQQNFSDAKNQQILGDVSTTYSMLPDHSGVVELARKIAGPGLRIIYLVREPITRTLSHHRHLVSDSSKSKMSRDVNWEIQQNPSLISYSCYASQIQPWIECFGRPNIHVVRFESYISDRQSSLDEIFKFLGVKSHSMVVNEAGFNRGENRRYAGRFTLALYKTRFFHSFLKPLTPDFARRMLRKIILRKADSQLANPTSETINYIFEKVKDDIAQLPKLLGTTRPFWDLDAAKKSHLEAIQS